MSSFIILLAACLCASVLAQDSTEPNIPSQIVLFFPWLFSTLDQQAASLSIQNALLELDLSVYFVSVSFSPSTHPIPFTLAEIHFSSDVPLSVLATSPITVNYQGQPVPGKAWIAPPAQPTDPLNPDNAGNADGGWSSNVGDATGTGSNGGLFDGNAGSNTGSNGGIFDGNAGGNAVSTGGNFDGNAGGSTVSTGGNFDGNAGGSTVSTGGNFDGNAGGSTGGNNGGWGSNVGNSGPTIGGPVGDVEALEVEITVNGRVYRLPTSARYLAMDAQLALLNHVVAVVASGTTLSSEEYCIAFPDQCDHSTGLSTGTSASATTGIVVGTVVVVALVAIVAFVIVSRRNKAKVIRRRVSDSSVAGLLSASRPSSSRVKSFSDTVEV